MAYKNFFYFDIETTSKSPSLFDLKLDDERGHDLFIKKWETMRKFEVDWNKEVDAVYIEKAPLIPEYGKIICLSFGMFKDDQKTIMTIFDEDEEVMIKKIVKIFGRASETRRDICGFNIKTFDLPFLIKKMHKYEIDLPLSINFSGMKPWEITLKELSEIWKGIGRTNASLDEITYELGIPSHKRIMSGDEVHDYYWSKNDKKSIIHHCEQDIESIIEVAKKLKI